jgi:hypothetical protein
MGFERENDDVEMCETSENARHFMVDTRFLLQMKSFGKKFGKLGKKIS